MSRPPAFTRALSCATVVLCCLGPAGGLPAGRAAEGVQIRELPDRLRVEVDGELFTEYLFQSGSRPSLYPVLGPGGLAVTRQWPMENPPESREERDHPHHRSLWFAHGDINGVDFWMEGPKAGKTVHEKFLEVKSGKDSGVIRSRNKLVGPDGKQVAIEERTFRIFRTADGRLFDFDVTIVASEGELRLGDTKEGTMAMRLAETMRLKPNPKGLGAGHIVNSEGLRDDATWGRRAKWVDYHGPVEGQTVGVTIMDHPSNPRHPTWWHVRDYGLFAANPFGVHEFEKKPKGTGDFVIPAGRSATFRYRFYIHRGDATQAGVASKYEDYAKPAAAPAVPR